MRNLMACIHINSLQCTEDKDPRKKLSDTVEKWSVDNKNINKCSLNTIYVTKNFIGIKVFIKNINKNPKSCIFYTVVADKENQMLKLCKDIMAKIDKNMINMTSTQQKSTPELENVEIIEIEKEIKMEIYLKKQEVVPNSFDYFLRYNSKIY